MCQDLGMCAREMYVYMKWGHSKGEACATGGEGMHAQWSSRWCFSKLQRLDMELQGSKFTLEF